MLRALGDNLLETESTPSFGKANEPMLYGAGHAVYCLSDQPVALTQIVTENIPVNLDPTTPYLSRRFQALISSPELTAFLALEHVC